MKKNNPEIEISRNYLYICLSHFVDAIKNFIRPM